MALYAEVSEAKALLEQLALVCKNRPTLAEALEGQLPQSVPEASGSTANQELRDEFFSICLDIY